MKVHYDLNISEISKPADILRYVKCGYTRLAFNRTIDVNEFKLESDNKKLPRDSKTNVRSRFEKRLSQPDLSTLIDCHVTEATTKLGVDLKLFSRLTLVASDLNQLTFFIREFLAHIRQFDIVACEARSSDVLTHAVNAMTVELITFDLGSAVTWLSRQLLARCAERGISIEVNLAAALATSHGRVNTVRFLNELRLFRCPAIVTVTSGAQNQLLVRNALGLACMLASMGVSDKLVAQLHANADTVVQRGLTRKHTVQGSAAIVQLGRRAGVVAVKVTGKRCDVTGGGAQSPDKKRQKCE